MRFAHYCTTICSATVCGLTPVIASLLQIEGRGACEQTRLLTEQKLSEVRQRIEDLRLLETGLKQLVDECQASAGDACPALDRLARTSR